MEGEDKDCIFCKIVKKEAPAQIVLENNTLLVIKNIKPVADVHLLVIPKVHIESFDGLDITNDGQIFLEMVKAVQTVVKSTGIGGGYKLIFNGGKYLKVNHLHWHLLGGEMLGGSEI
jgi:histidine triad (HIT) family protein